MIFFFQCLRKARFLRKPQNVLYRLELLVGMIGRKCRTINAMNIKIYFLSDFPASLWVKITKRLRTFDFMANIRTWKRRELAFLVWYVDMDLAMVDYFGIEESGAKYRKREKESIWIYFSLFSSIVSDFPPNIACHYRNSACFVLYE